MKHLYRILGCLSQGISAVLLLGACQLAFAGNPDWKACIISNDQGWILPGTTGEPDITKDPALPASSNGGAEGWTRAWRFVYHNGTTPPATVDLIGSKNVGSQIGEDIFIAVQTNYPPTTDSFVVIGLDTGTGLAGKKLLRIKLTTSQVLSGPLTWSLHRPTPGSSTTGRISWDLNTPNTERISAYGFGDATKWRMAIKLNKADLQIPAAGAFGFYFATGIKVDPMNPTPFPASNPLARQYAWPTPANSSEFITTSSLNVPPPAAWGTASVDPLITGTCNGVAIDTHSITANPSELAIGTNTLSATVTNTSFTPAASASSPPLPREAQKIKAAFYYFPFGMSQEWRLIGETSVQNVPAPTGPAQNPTPGSKDYAQAWAVSASSPGYVAGAKVCVRVDLKSEATSSPTDWSTTFANTSTWNNFHFATMSSLDSAPVINSRGWPLAQPGGKHQLELFVKSQIDTITPDLARKGLNFSREDFIREGPPLASFDRIVKSAYFPAERKGSFQAYAELLLNNLVKVSQMVYGVDACVRTGQFIELGGVQHEICSDVGSFGYKLRHAGLGGIDWNINFQGAGNLGTNSGRFRMEVAPNTETKLAIKFKAEDRVERWCASLRTAGAPTAALAGMGALGAFVFRPRRRKPTCSDGETDLKI